MHVVCNNAGVAAGGGIDNISLDNWRWVVDVNLMGVLYGVRSFLPHIRTHGEGGHIVNTASMAGMTDGMGFSPYAATKFAVVACRKGLACSSSRTASASACSVRVRAHQDRRERAQSPRALWPVAAARSGEPGRGHGGGDRKRIEAGLDPAAVAARVLTAIREDELYIFTHPGMRAEVEARFAAILAAMDGVSAP